MVPIQYLWKVFLMYQMAGTGVVTMSGEVSVCLLRLAATIGLDITTMMAAEVLELVYQEVCR